MELRLRTVTVALPPVAAPPAVEAFLSPRERSYTTRDRSVDEGKGRQGSGLHLSHGQRDVEESAKVRGQNEVENHDPSCSPLQHALVSDARAGGDERTGRQKEAERRLLRLLWVPEATQGSLPETVEKLP